MSRPATAAPYCWMLEPTYPSDRTLWNDPEMKGGEGLQQEVKRSGGEEITHKGQGCEGIALSDTACGLRLWIGHLPAGRTDQHQSPGA